MTITEFMMARIAEDERAIERTDKIVERGENGPFLNVPLIDRLNAECEAKRKIVQYLEALWLESGRDAEAAAQYRSILWTVQRLASVYANHPEFDDLT